MVLREPAWGCHGITVGICLTMTNKIEQAKAHLATCMERDDFPSHNCACNCEDVAGLLAENERLTSDHFDHHGACSMGGNTPCHHYRELQDARLEIDDCEHELGIVRSDLNKAIDNHLSYEAQQHADI